MIPPIPRKLTPPNGRPTYQTDQGLTFWMDYQHYGPPLLAPTIRTTDPHIRLIFVPGSHRSDAKYLLHHHGKAYGFFTPHASTIMDSSEYEELYARCPDLDIAITRIGGPLRWLYNPRGQRPELTELPTERGFASRTEQDQITTLFCALLAPAAKSGPISMARETTSPGRVGFDLDLRQKLASGALILTT